MISWISAKLLLSQWSTGLFAFISINQLIVCLALLLNVVNQVIDYSSFRPRPLRRPAELIVPKTASSMPCGFLSNCRNRFGLVVFRNEPN
jgi:hypothetical protein